MVRSGRERATSGHDKIEPTRRARSPAARRGQGLGENVLGVAGGDGAQLIEEMDNGLVDGCAHHCRPSQRRKLSGRLTALYAYEREIKPATGAPGLPGYEPAIVERMLLIGTGADGVLVALQLADGAGAIPVSVVSHLNLDPYLD